MSKPGYIGYIDFMKCLGWKKEHLIINETNLNFTRVCQHFNLKTTKCFISIKCPSGHKMSIGGFNQILYSPEIKDSYFIGISLKDKDGNEVPGDTKIRLTKEKPCDDVVQLARPIYDSIKIKNGECSYHFKFGIELDGDEYLYIYNVASNESKSVDVADIKFKIGMDLWSDGERKTVDIVNQGNTNEKIIDKKITAKSLAEQHLSLISSVRNEYMNIHKKEFDDKDIIKKVNWIYKQYRLAEPIVEIVDTPQEAKDTPYNSTPIYDYNHTKSEDESLINEMLFDAWKQLNSSVDESLIDIIRKEISDKLYDIDKENREETNIITNMSIGISMDKKYEVPTLAMYDYFLRIGVIKDTFNVLKDFFDYIKSGIVYRVYHMRHASVVRNPNALQVFKDDNGRLHNEKDYAVIWRNVNSNIKGLNYVKGVYFEPEMFCKIFIDKNITNQEILNMSNVEQKSVAIQYVGYDKFIEDLHAKKIDEWTTKSLVNGNTAICELYDLKMKISERRDTTVRFVKVQDHSTGKTTVLGVPVSEETNTAKGAVAWTFGMTEEEYCPHLES